MLAQTSTPAWLRCTVQPKRSSRDATSDDADVVAALYNDYAATRGLDPRMTQDNAACWIQSHHTMQRPLWLACLAGRPVAMLSFIGYADRPGCRHSAELGISVRSELRGAGLGRWLVSRAIEHAPSLGLDRLLAYITGDNHASLSLFFGRGFREWGRLPGVTHEGGRRHDIVVLGMELDPSDTR